MGAGTSAHRAAVVLGLLPVQSALDRFLALVRRELGAEDVRVLEADEDAAGDPCELRCRIADGRGIGVRFASPPPDREASQKRLEMLAATCDSVVEEDKSHRRRSRPPVMQALQDELATLCARAAAVNAIVIDANSPVEWGAARPQEAIPLAPRVSSSSSAPGAADAREPEPSIAVVSRRALHVVRGLPELAELRKGKHLRFVESTGEGPFVVHSFAGIYLLVLVFDAPLDELRAERTILEALPRIERLVLALPPLEPPPYGGVVALRRPRRR
jgi:hypothetical protein